MASQSSKYAVRFSLVLTTLSSAQTYVHHSSVHLPVCHSVYFLIHCGEKCRYRVASDDNSTVQWQMLSVG